jgi:phosphatidate cytidylyltransferase
MSDALAQPLLLTFLGVFAFLAAAQAAAWALMRRGAPSPTLRNATERIRAWWVMVATLGLAFLAGRTATIALFALMSFWCLREFLSLTPTRKADHYALAAAFYLFLPLQYALLVWPWLPVFTIAIPVYGFLLLPVLALVLGETGDFLQRVAKTQWALMLAVYCLSHAPALLLLRLPEHAAGPFGLLAFLLLVTQASDVAQYLFGKALGRTPLAPSVSPSKTREGLLLGGGAAILLGGLLHPLTPFGLWASFGYAAALVAAGALGGLVLSAVKRSLGAKDWGVMVEGHGGMLDRADGLAFAAPLFFHLVNYFHAL